MKVLILFLGIFNIHSAVAQTPVQTQFVCNAQCVYINPQENIFFMGAAVEGWSNYSDTEAFADLGQQCPPSFQLVQNTEMYKNDIRDKQVDISFYENSIRVYTENQFYFDVKFANPKDSCHTTVTNPNGGRRFINGKKVGG